MTSNDWQAWAAVVGTTVVVLGFLAGVFLKLLGAFFVTRKEHRVLSVRVDGVEDGMTKTVKKGDLDEFSNRMFSIETNLSKTSAELSKTNGLLEGVQESSARLATQLNILIEAGLSRERS